MGGYGGKGLEGQPRPVIVDPELKWAFEEEGCKLMELVREGRGRAPWIVTSEDESDIPEGKRRCLDEIGGKFLVVGRRGEDGRMDWKEILRKLKDESIGSIMIEGGGSVINSLLQEEYFDIISSVILTIAPVWLGQGGVTVSPKRVDQQRAALRLHDVSWRQFGQDVIMCGRINRTVSENAT